MKRRDFLKGALLGAAGLAAGAGSAPVPEPAPAQALPRRPYGKERIPLSIVGFGGIIVMNMAPERAARVVADAVARGVNYFDVAPSYGNAEVILGPALEPFRSRCFLACKTTQRARKEAEKELRNSLKTLRTDHFDLYQLHALTDVKKDVDAAFAADGIMGLLEVMKKDGVIRHIGFSAHSEAAALAALERYPFDSVLFPVNITCWEKGRFGPGVLAAAAGRGASVLALKALARQPWGPHADKTAWPKCWYEPFADEHLAALALRWTLGQPITAALTPGDETIFRRALDVAMNYSPLAEAEKKELATRTAADIPLFKQA